MSGNTEFDPSLLSQSLALYYQHLFPFKLLCEWLKYGEAHHSYFALREFAFIFEGDIYRRHLSFDEGFELERELSKNVPFKLDIGAVFSNKPKEWRKYLNMRPVEREFVIDIDLSDYNDIRRCCTESKICCMCWRWMTIAVKVLGRILQEDYNWQNMLWVFSGRRGIHCWVADQSARSLSNSDRCAIADYLTVTSGREEFYRFVSKKMFMHPMLRKAYDTIMESGEFDRIVVEQNLINEKCLYWFLDFAPNAETKSEFESICKNIFSLTSAEERWAFLRKMFYEAYSEDRSNAENNEVSYLAELCFKVFVLKHAYPRLDVNVSRDTGHLLKSPFCVHPRTGIVAVPLSLEMVPNLNIDGLPRVDRLLAELSKFSLEKEPENRRKILGYKHTSLAPYVTVFKNFVSNLSSI